jgi:hypothetical protein
MSRACTSSPLAWALARRIVGAVSVFTVMAWRAIPIGAQESDRSVARVAVDQAGQTKEKPQVNAQLPAETRHVGNKGDLDASVAFSLVSLESTGSQGKAWYGVYSALADVGKFVTNRFAVEAGMRFNGSFGTPLCGAAPCKRTGDLTTGVRVYLTPEKEASAYVGASYEIRVVGRDPASRDIGSVLAKVGAEVLVGEKMSIFIEGGYGSSLRNFGTGRVTFSGGTRVAF